MKTVLASVAGGAGAALLAGSAFALLGPPQFPQSDLHSPDGTWTAEIDGIGQVTNLFPPDQPVDDNVFETVVYEASASGGNLSRRVDGNFVLVEAIVDQDGAHSFGRLESLDSDLSIEIDNLMIDGPAGGVLVTIRCVNKGPAPQDCKLFYYCDFDISGDFGDDEAFTVPNPPEPRLIAIEQFDNKGSEGPKPLWFGGCPNYKSWQIDLYPELQTALDDGVAQLADADGTEPGSADHTAALSSATATLEPGESLEMLVGIGGVGFTAPGLCETAPPCPWDCQPMPDNNVGINDLLALLSQWGGAGGCDFNGGGVGITDLLKLLSTWGPCR